MMLCLEKKHSLLFYTPLKLAADDTKQLDAAPNAVDYLYDTCSEAAMRMFTDLVLEKELNRSMEFKRAWNENYTCLTQVPEAKKKQMTALSAFVANEQQFQKTFNEDVETKGANFSTYEKDFNFKSLHFLLMSSMEMHKNNCMTGYIYTDDYVYDAKIGSEVRFGRFMKAHGSFAESTKLAREESVILNITSCFFVNLKGNTCSRKSEYALLLSPAEVFTVESKKEISDDDGLYTLIVLTHSNLKSRDFCHLPR